jgi:hypothetical protein
MKIGYRAAGSGAVTNAPLATQGANLHLASGRLQSANETIADQAVLELWPVIMNALSSDTRELRSGCGSLIRHAFCCFEKYEAFEVVSRKPVSLPGNNDPDLAPTRAPQGSDTWQPNTPTDQEYQAILPTAGSQPPLEPSAPPEEGSSPQYLATHEATAPAQTELPSTTGVPVVLGQTVPSAVTSTSLNAPPPGLPEPAGVTQPLLVLGHALGGDNTGWVPSTAGPPVQPNRPARPPAMIPGVFDQAPTAPTFATAPTAPPAPAAGMGTVLRSAAPYSRGDIPLICCISDSKILGVQLFCDPDETIVQGDRPLAASTGVTVRDPVYFANNLRRIREAHLKRQVQKFVPVLLTDAEKKEMKDIALEFVKQMQNDKKKIERIVGGLLFGNYKSAKWSTNRAVDGLNKLHQSYNPHYKFSAAVKVESYRDGKPPRLLVADGDAGQIMAWLVMGVLERYTFSTYKVRSIKGMEKGLRMSELAKDLQHRARSALGEVGDPVLCSILENDGSAWDACMSLLLRELQENVIMDGLAEMISDFIVPLSEYTEQRLSANKLATYKIACVPKINMFVERDISLEELTCAVTKKQYLLAVDAVRRSGCRGTSILNFLANMITWVWVLAGPRATTLIRPNAQKFTDVFGVSRFVKFCFEGDDSILSLTGILSPEQVATMSERWTRCGHRPNLYLRATNDVAEFTGYKFIVDPYGLVEGTDVPDLKRQFAGLGYTAARGAIEAAVRGDVSTFSKVVVPGMYARAYPVSKRMPHMGSFMLRYAELHAARGAVDQYTYSGDDLVRMDAFDKADLPEFWKEHNDEAKLCAPSLRWQNLKTQVQQAASTSLCTTSLYEEACLAYRHGWCASADEYTKFITNLGAVTIETDKTIFREIVPDLLKN